MTDACRIYVADLAAYNAGRLHGVWIDLDGKEESDVWEAINDMLAKSPEPNVMRRKCEECGHYQTDARPYAENSADCTECGAPLSEEFKPSGEEWAIHDHEGFAGLIKGEWPDIGELCEAAEILQGDDEDKRRGLLWLVNDRGGSIADAILQAGDVLTYQSDAHDLAADYAQELFEEEATAEERDRRNRWPFTCIDWGDAGKELEMGGDIAETEQAGERFLVTNASCF